MKEEIYLEDLVPSLNKTHVKLNLIFLNKLLKDAAKSNKPWRNKNFIKKIGCQINKDKKCSTTIYGWKMGYRTVPFDKLNIIVSLSNYTWRDVEKNLISIKSGIRRGEISFKFPIKIDRIMGSIIGHILGDGSIEKKLSRIYYYNSNIELIKEFMDNMSIFFKTKVLIYVAKKKRFEEQSKKDKVNNLNEIIKDDLDISLAYPKLCSIILYALFGKFAKGKNKKITSEIKDCNIEFKKGLIRAFFDDDGSIRSDDHMMRFYQDDKKLLENIKLLIINLGIKPQRIRSYLKRNKPRYYFTISGFREYYNFYKLIGCTSSKKEEEFKLLINKVKGSRYFKKKYAL